MWKWMAIAVVAAAATRAHAGWLDWLKPAPTNRAATVTGLNALSEDEIVRGLKAALAQGARQAVAQLGRPDGFLKNLDVKIPVPDQLRSVEKGLRTLKQDRLADEFITTLNRAAEAAVPEAAGIFADAVAQLTVADARGILTGPPDAATQYFRKVGEARLTERMLPIVRQATQQAGVTAAYKNMTQQAGGLTALLGQPPDLDQYVTGKALDGLFKLVAAEEKQIRENPVARSTELLQKVFGAAPAKN